MRHENAGLSTAVSLAIVLAAPGIAYAQLEWRLSVKWIHDLSDNPPPLTNYDLDEAIAKANTILDGYGRGYRVRIIEEFDIYEDDLPPPPPTIWFCEVDGNAVECDEGDPGAQLVEHWFDAPFIVPVRRELDRAAEADYDAGSDGFRWSPDAINVYVLHTDRGGLSVQPPYGTGLLLGVGGGITTPFHEVGHFLWLCHTFGCTDETPESGCAIIDPVSGPLEDPPRDRIGDTLPDHRDWERRQIAWYHFCMTYTDLPLDDQDRVDDVFLNLMSYHGRSADRVRLTPDQLDRMADASNLHRLHVTNGWTHFVDASAGATPDGSSTAPYPTVAGGLAAAAATPENDIVLLRSGTYHEALVFEYPVTLRATRGPAVVRP